MDNPEKLATRRRI